MANRGLAQNKPRVVKFVHGMKPHIWKAQNARCEFSDHFARYKISFSVINAQYYITCLAKRMV